MHVFVWSFCFSSGVSSIHPLAGILTSADGLPSMIDGSLWECGWRYNNQRKWI